MKPIAIRVFLLVAGVTVFFASAYSARAGEADIVDVKITAGASDTYRFDVTVKHGDTGWDHYANKWDVLDPDGKVLGTRNLAHPHENEQPFTRSLPGVHIPKTVSKVTVRAHDSVHGYGGKEMTVDVPR